MLFQMLSEATGMLGVAMLLVSCFGLAIFAD